jgi:hypothetical protein
MHIPLDVPAFVDHDFDFRSVRADTTLHGPALPDDPPDAIYDDFSGALAMEDEVPDARDSSEAGPSRTVRPRLRKRTAAIQQPSQEHVIDRSIHR